MKATFMNSGEFDFNLGLNKKGSQLSMNDQYEILSIFISSGKQKIKDVRCRLVRAQNAQVSEVVLVMIGGVLGPDILQCVGENQMSPGILLECQRITKNFSIYWLQRGIVHFMKR